MLGFFFAIISSASFGLNNAAVRRGVLTGSVMQGLYVTVILGVPLFLVAALVTGQLFDAAVLPLQSYLLLIGAGVIHFYGGRYCNYRSIAAMGANRSAPIRNMAIPVSIVIAILFLNETVTPFMVLGIILIMIGPAIIFEFPNRNGDSRSGNRSGSSSPIGLEMAHAVANSGAAQLGEMPAKAVSTQLVLRQTEGYIFGSLTALAYGITPILIRVALRDSNLPIMGALVSYTSASVFMLFLLVIPGRVEALQGLNRKAARWFLLATVMVFFAQLFRYVALGLAPVTVVAPLQRTSGIFALAFAYLINREAESFNARVILGIVLAIVGSVALAF